MLMRLEWSIDTFHELENYILLQKRSALHFFFV